MNKLSDEIRCIEVEIDTFYTKNPLLCLSFAPAVWYVLAVLEDRLFLPYFSGNETLQLSAARHDRYIFVMKHLMSWLKDGCAPGGTIPDSYAEEYYQAADALIELALQYDDFCMAFTYASRGLTWLEVQGWTLVVHSNLSNESRYEAYNRLIKPVEGIPLHHKFHEQLSYVSSAINKSVRVQGSNFTVKMNYQIICKVMSIMNGPFQGVFSLPETWQFTCYSLADFKQCMLSIVAMTYIQQKGRMLASLQEAEALGFLGALLVIQREDLIKKIENSTGLPEDKIKAILSDITLGESHSSVTQFDPALQPLVLINETTFVIMPSLLINSALERNLIVLLNKIPKERKMYLSLVQQKEGIMRERIIKNIPHGSWRTYSGRIPDNHQLPDIDLALINDAEKVCLLLELKWFIEPAEAREVIEKSQEIVKGISQLLIVLY